MTRFVVVELFDDATVTADDLAVEIVNRDDNVKLAYAAVEGKLNKGILRDGPTRQRETEVER